MNKFCQHCGAPLEKDVNFCGICGTKAKEMASLPVVAQTPMPASDSIHPMASNITGFNAVSQEMPNDGQVYLKNPQTNVIKKMPIGCSIWMYFFGFWVPLIRGNFKWAAIIFVVSVLYDGMMDEILSDVDSWDVYWSFMLLFTACISAVYNKIQISDLVSKGWIPASIDSRRYLILNGIIGDTEGIVFPKRKPGANDNWTKYGSVVVVIMLVIWRVGLRVLAKEDPALYAEISGLGVGMLVTLGVFCVIGHFYNKEYRYNFRI